MIVIIVSLIGISVRIEPSIFPSSAMHNRITAILFWTFIIPLMIDNNGGSIVNISSTAALIGMAGAGGYTASKGAVRSITKAAAVDYGKHGIRVNSVHPGYIETPMSAPYINQYKDYFLSQIATPDLGNAEDVASAILFLASDEANHISGIELPVDGGLTAK
jgi:NAD(P)-dependent dehydrogenase (short-subunit alcohol dehydrogenase family)